MIKYRSPEAGAFPKVCRDSKASGKAGTGPAREEEQMRSESYRAADRSHRLCRHYKDLGFSCEREGFK